MCKYICVFVYIKILKMYYECIICCYVSTSHLSNDVDWLCAKNKFQIEIVDKSMLTQNSKGDVHKLK